MDPGAGDASSDEVSVDRAPGWPQVLAVGAGVAAFVLGLAVLTSVLPSWGQDLVFRTPLTIVVLVVVTVGLLVRLARPSPR